MSIALLTIGLIRLLYGQKINCAAFAMHGLCSKIWTSFDLCSDPRKILNIRNFIAAIGPKGWTMTQFLYIPANTCFSSHY